MAHILWNALVVLWQILWLNPRLDVVHSALCLQAGQVWDHPSRESGSEREGGYRRGSGNTGFVIFFSVHGGLAWQALIWSDPSSDKCFGSNYCIGSIRYTMIHSTLDQCNGVNTWEKMTKMDRVWKNSTFLEPWVHWSFCNGSQKWVQEKEGHDTIQAGSGVQSEQTHEQSSISLYLSATANIPQQSGNPPPPTADT